MKIAIITTFQSFIPQYSLTGIVKDRAEMLTKYGHEVHLFVSERYKGEDFPGMIMEKRIPFTRLADYTSMAQFTGDDKSYKPGPGVDTPTEHKRIKNLMAVMLREELAKDYELVITEDLIFQGWHLPFAVAIVEASKDLPNVRWLHAIHSVPSRGSDYWDIKLYGKKHKILYPNRADMLRAVEQYRGTLDDIRVIPHIKDFRTFWDFSQDSRDFIDWCPSIMQADIVQLYPASVDRLEAKRLDYVIKVFANFKRLGKSVCLVVACQWATVPRHIETINRYKKLATEHGLIVGVDIVFTPDFKKPSADKRSPFAVGLPKHMIRELMMFSNVFMFPTKEETFGLVLPETAMCSGALPILNGSLDMMHEVAGFNGIYFGFGSHHNVVQHHPEEQFIFDIALIALGRLNINESLRYRTFVRQTLNYDFLYKNYYAPLLAESKLWI